jgi:hypothetical protein
MSYMVDKSPATDKLLQREVRVWEPKEHRPTLTWSRSGYKPYSTYVCLLNYYVLVLIRPQSQEQVLCVDAYSKGKAVGARFLMLGIVYIKDKSTVAVHVQKPNSKFWVILRPFASCTEPNAVVSAQMCFE